MRMANACCWLCILVLVTAASGEEKRSASGPLAAMPSKPGEHIRKIEALGENEWLALGEPAADPKWGRARGRSWSSNMPSAANLGGAFVFAEGVHAYVKPDGHYMNDIWFYDINANAWVCLYPGIEVKTITEQIKNKEWTVDERGLLVDKQGQILPPLLIHAYDYLEYDPDRKQFAFFGSQFGNYFTTGEKGVFAEANKLFEEQQKGKSLPLLSPFFYDAATGQLECFAVTNAPKGQPYGANNLVYLEKSKQLFYGGSDGVWLLDRDKRTWQSVKVEGEPPQGIDHCAAYDPQGDRIYYFMRDGKSSGENFLIYDVKSSTWSKPQPKGTGPLSCTSYESIFNYDAASDRLVVIRLYEDKEKDTPGTRRAVYAYDPETNSWADPLPLPPEVVKSIRNGNYGFYDRKLNAYFCHFAGDSNDDGVMWAYRYQK